MWYNISLKVLRKTLLTISQIQRYKIYLRYDCFPNITIFKIVTYLLKKGCTLELQGEKQMMTGIPLRYYISCCLLVLRKYASFDIHGMKLCTRYR